MTKSHHEIIQLKFRLKMDVCCYKTVSAIIKVLSLKALTLPPSFNQTAWTHEPTFQLGILITFINTLLYNYLWK
jgi:hypothetical protein